MTALVRSLVGVIVSVGSTALGRGSAGAAAISEGTIPRLRIAARLEPLSIAPAAAFRASLAALCLAALLCGCGEGDGAAQGGVERSADDASRSDGAGRSGESRSDEAGTELFVDVASAVGLDYTYFNGMTGDLQYLELIGAGAALFDYDGDDDLDAYLVQGRLMEEADPIEKALFPPRHPQPLSGRLYRNDLVAGRPGSLRFADVTVESGIAAVATGYGQGVAVGDYDGDGRLDLYLTNFGPDQLLRNVGDGRWSDVTRAAGIDQRHWSVAAAFFDADRDGDLDLWVGTYVAYDPTRVPPCFDLTGAPDYCGPGKFAAESDFFYRNRGNGTFEDATEAAGLGGVRNPALGVAVADLDGNGWLDLFVANDARPNLLWLGDGPAHFQEGAMLAGVALSGAGEAQASMGVAVGDYDGEGHLDLYKTNLTREGSTLYSNLGGGVFADVTQEARLLAPTRPFTSFGCGFLDYDNDGWLDLFQVSGAIQRIPALVERGDPFPLHQPNQLFRNRGDGTFEDVSSSAGPALALSEVSRGAAFGDVDDDGDTDVLVVNTNAPARLLRNEVGSQRRWLGVRMVEGDPPRDAPGALATLVRDGAPALVRAVRIEGSYASASDPRIVFGLGDSSEASGRVVVRWPNGERETFADVPVGRYTTLRKGQGTGA